MFDNHCPPSSVIVLVCLSVTHRTIIVRLSSLVVLVVTLFILISCTQQQVEETEDDGNTCQFEPQDTFNSVINSTEDDCQAVSK